MVVASMGVAMIFVFRALIVYMFNENLIVDKQIDLKLITVNDYSASTSIPADLFKNFKIMNQGRLSEDQSHLKEFEKSLVTKIEDWLE